jgi:antagonist of KipI
MKIRIKKAGLMATIQDLGRHHYLSQGVPVSGVMDSLSAQIANLSLGNAPNDAVIEFTQSGAAFVTEEDVLICLSGAGAFLKTERGTLPSNRPVFVPAGTSLYLENAPWGCRSYLAAAGGWDMPEILGSKSTYITARFGGLEGRCLKENDILNSSGNLTITTKAIWDSLNGHAINFPKWSVARDLFLQADRNTIRVMRGREFNWFGEPSTSSFFSQGYVLGNNSNRMGYQLLGKSLRRVAEGELLSTAVTPGTIQVTNNGDLVLLMADCQTTGGYPRIAQVAAVDLPLCAQLKPGDAIHFKEISWKEAEKLYIERELDLRKLALAIKQRYNIE